MSLEHRIKMRQHSQMVLTEILDGGDMPSEKVAAIKAYMDGEYLAEMSEDSKAIVDAICTNIK